MKLILFLFLFLFCVSVRADIETDCGSVEVSTQVAECVAYEKEQSDYILNLTYKTVLNRIDQQYKNSPALGERYVLLLREAQREWIKLRDVDCKLEAFEIEEAAKAYQVTIDNCISRMSGERSDYLNRIAPDI